MKRAILLLLLISAPAGAQTRSDSGLETDNYKHVYVAVECLTEKARSIGLTTERIQTRMELRLRSAGLTPTSFLKADLKAEYLYVNVNVVGDGFSIDLDYKRYVTYNAHGRLLKKIVPTWSAEGAGTHGRDAAYIMNSLDRALDKFLNEYLKANQK